jgi:hypothetical protein
MGMWEGGCRRGGWVVAQGGNEEEGERRCEGRVQGDRGFATLQHCITRF